MTGSPKAPRTFETARLAFAPPTRDDAAVMFRRYASDPEVTRYLGWPRHQTVADTEAYVTFASMEWREAPVGAYLIRAREDGRLLGATGLMTTGPGQLMTGYVLARDAWGQGFATEALTAMVDVAWRIRGRRVYALCHAEHAASQRVLEKCGFTRDVSWSKQMSFPNLGRGVPQDVACFERRLTIDHSSRVPVRD